MSNTYHPVQSSQWTPGRWQVGDHELTSGDVIEVLVGTQSIRGRVEHDGFEYVVIQADGTRRTLAHVSQARYIER
jgi:hypothetical protein